MGMETGMGMAALAPLTLYLGVKLAQALEWIF
jgi:hypothetical protein